MHRKLTAILGLAAAGLLFCGSANADVLYDSYSTPRYDSADPGHLQSPYFYNVPFSTDIIWDDVPIPVGLLSSPSATITQVQFGIARRPNAGAVTIDAYWAPMVPDNGANRGSGDPLVEPYDGPDEDPGTPIKIGQFVLAANGGALSLTPITVGDGINPLFTTGVLNQHYSPTIGSFMLGLKFSTTDNQNGWVIATGANNRDVVWDDYQDGTPSSISEFTFGPDSLNENILGTMSIKVTGTVPEPGSFALLGLAGLAALRRRRA
jgi:hypothetical protein